MFEKKTLIQRVAFFTTLRQTLNTSIRNVYPFLAVFSVGTEKEMGRSAGTWPLQWQPGGWSLSGAHHDVRGRKIGMLMGRGVFLDGSLASVSSPVTSPSF
jgi:hypothetical protein